MILHYLKVAVRSLMKYKMQSLISAICLAVGIVCFSYVYLFVSNVDKSDQLSRYDRRVLIQAVWENQLSTKFSSDEVLRLEEELKPLGVSHVAAYTFANEGEVEFLDSEGKVTPYLFRYSYANAYFFHYYDMTSELDLSEFKPDEVVLSAAFARKVFGDKDPRGETLRLAGKKDEGKIYRIRSVVDDSKIQMGYQQADCYFSVEVQPRMNNIFVELFLPDGMSSQAFEDVVGKMSFQRESGKILLSPQLNNQDGVQKNIAKFLLLMLSSLILVSGMIQFLKFVIQLFFTRQRELALRKCMGSDKKGIFMLLASEVFVVMTLAWLLSLLFSEWTLLLLKNYLPDQMLSALPWKHVYLIQCVVYILVIGISLLIIISPVLKLQWVSMNRFILTGRKKHIWRNIMIGIQWTISMFFVGGVILIWMSWNELIFDKMYMPLSDQEEDQIVMLPLNSSRLKENIEPIITEVRKMPEVEEVTYISMLSDLQSYTYMNYKHADGRTSLVQMSSGNTDYFRFFHIPMDGKEVDVTADGQIYVSEKVKQVLDQEGNIGTIRLDDKDYQIAGVYKALHGEIEDPRFMGSVFMPSSSAGYYYIKLREGTDVSLLTDQITAVCREFVPITLPLEIYSLEQEVQVLSVIKTMRLVLLMLALISMILVVLSIYSAISMDTLGRRKEVAIRKINGARSWDIVLLFGKVYIFIFFLSFIVVCPLLKIAFDEAFYGMITCIYRWNWMFYLFIIMAFLLVSVTGFKIWRVVCLNPADVIKRE